MLKMKVFSTERSRRKTMKKVLSILAIATVVISIIVLFACSGSTSISVDSGKGNLQIYLTDKPIDLTNVEAVNVTIDEVLVFPIVGEGEESVPINLAATDYTGGGATFNLLSLVNGEKALLGNATIDQGFYDLIRLNVSSGELLIDDDGDDSTQAIVEPLEIPSGKVDVAAPFEIRDGYTTYITLDFDASKSIHVNENPNKYILRPVINLVSTELTPVQ
jgi:hypothetical protein